MRLGSIRAALLGQLASALVACSPGGAREQPGGLTGEGALADLPRQAQETLDLIKKGGCRAIVVQADVSKPDEVERMVKQIAAEHSY